MLRLVRLKRASCPSDLGWRAVLKRAILWATVHTYFGTIGERCVRYISQHDIGWVGK